MTCARKPIIPSSACPSLHQPSALTSCSIRLFSSLLQSSILLLSYQHSFQIKIDRIYEYRLRAAFNTVWLFLNISDSCMHRTFPGTPTSSTLCRSSQKIPVAASSLGRDGAGSASMDRYQILLLMLFSSYQCRFF